MIREEIIKYIEEAIIPLYTKFDKAHNVDHVTTVIAESAVLTQHYPILDDEMVYVIAAFHDTGLCQDRENHHITSGIILKSDGFITSRFSHEQLTTMVEAIEDHRASSKNEPRSLYGRIVAEADRIISTDITLRRTVQYGLQHSPDATTEEHFARFCDHLRAKYAEGGYLKLYIPQSDNTLRLNELRVIINNPNKLRSKFLDIFEEETS